MTGQLNEPDESHTHGHVSGSPALVGELDEHDPGRIGALAAAAFRSGRAAGLHARIAAAHPRARVWVVGGYEAVAVATPGPVRWHTTARILAGVLVVGALLVVAIATGVLELDVPGRALAATLAAAGGLLASGSASPLADMAALVSGRPIDWILAVVAVDPDLQGEGRGRRLVGHVCEQLRAERASALLTTFGKRRQAFYRRCGAGRLWRPVPGVLVLPDESPWPARGEVLTGSG